MNFRTTCGPQCRTEHCRWRRRLLRRGMIGGAVLAGFAASPSVTWASSAEPGLTAVDLMQGVAFWSSAMAIGILVIVEFLLRNRIGRVTYHWLLLLGLFVLPAISLTGTSVVVLEGSKAVTSCASCHSMDPYIHDMLSPSSSTLAARHYRNKWISDNQCYECHTTYGIHGTMNAKLDGVRDWWDYTTDNWQRPIQFVGKYPDSICLDCHKGTPRYENAWPHHQGVFAAEKKGEVNCIFCHGPPHPSAAERGAEPKFPGTSQSAPSTSEGEKPKSPNAATPAPSQDREKE